MKIDNNQPGELLTGLLKSLQSFFLDETEVGDYSVEENYFIIIQTASESKHRYIVFNIEYLFENSHAKGLILDLAHPNEDFPIALCYLLTDTPQEELKPGLMIKYPTFISVEKGLNAWVLGNTEIEITVDNSNKEFSALVAYPMYQQELDILAKVGLQKVLEKLGQAILLPDREPIQ